MLTNTFSGMNKGTDAARLPTLACAPNDPCWLLYCPALYSECLFLLLLFIRLFICICMCECVYQGPLTTLCFQFFMGARELKLSWLTLQALSVSEPCPQHLTERLLAGLQSPILLFYSLPQSMPLALSRYCVKCEGSNDRLPPIPGPFRVVCIRLERTQLNKSDVFGLGCGGWRDNEQ